MQSRQSRRVFFKSVAGLFVSAGILQDVPIADAYKDLPTYHPNTGPPVFGQYPIQEQLVKLTRIIHRRLVRKIGIYPPVLPEHTGDNLIHFSVDFTISVRHLSHLSDREIILMCVDPTVDLLSTTIIRKHAIRFAELPVPGSVGAAVRANRDG